MSENKTKQNKTKDKRIIEEMGNDSTEKKKNPLTINPHIFP